MRNYVNFRGRARRREFWMFTLFNTLVYLLLLAVGLVLLGAVIYKSVAEGGDAAEHATAYTLAVAGLLLLVYGWMLATFLPGLAVRVRRLHDIGLSGKWLLGYYALYWVCFYRRLPDRSSDGTAGCIRPDCRCAPTSTATDNTDRCTPRRSHRARNTQPRLSWRGRSHGSRRATAPVPESRVRNPHSPETPPRQACGSPSASRRAVRRAATCAAAPCPAR